MWLTSSKVSLELLNIVIQYACSTLGAVLPWRVGAKYYVHSDCRQVPSYLLTYVSEPSSEWAGASCDMPEVHVGARQHGTGELLC